MDKAANLNLIQCYNVNRKDSRRGIGFFTFSKT